MEESFIAWLRERLPGYPQVPLGIGDDAAVLRLAAQADCVVTSDLLAEGSHFVLETTREQGGGEGNCPPATVRQVGRKALAVNLSDLAAMAAKPLAVVVSVLVPREGGEALARELYEGMLPLAEEFEVSIAGGDTNSWQGPLVVSVTAIGQTTERGVLTRGGARAGDALLVTGSLGGSLLGHHLDFAPRVAESLLLHERYGLHAGMDISDGLTLDLSRMCAASGCGAEVELAAVPIAPVAVQCSGGDAQAALEHALGDGEDFELLLAVPEAEAVRMLADQPLSVPLTRIGRFCEETVLRQLREDGTRAVLNPRGYWH